MLVSASLFFTAAISYIVLGMVSLFIYRNYNAQDTLLIGPKVVKDIIVGLAWGAGFIALNNIIPAFSIGLPTSAFALETQSRFLIVVGVAPVIEELFFRGIMFSYLLGKFKGLLSPLSGIKDKTIMFWTAVIIQALAFSAYHAAAYGSFELASGSFFVAALAGVLFALIASRQKSVTSAIMAHVAFNGWLLTSLTVVFG